jgi:hypothetical protein
LPLWFLGGWVHNATGSLPAENRHQNRLDGFLGCYLFETRPRPQLQGVNAKECYGGLQYSRNSPGVAATEIRNFENHNSRDFEIVIRSFNSSSTGPWCSFSTLEEEKVDPFDVIDCSQFFLQVHSLLPLNRKS